MLRSDAAMKSNYITPYCIMSANVNMVSHCCGRARWSDNQMVKWSDGQVVFNTEAPHIYGIYFALSVEVIVISCGNTISSADYIIISISIINNTRKRIQSYI